MNKKVFIPIISALVAAILLLSPIAPVQHFTIPSIGQPLGQLLHPSGNPFAHTFSDTKDIRTATYVVAASDSEHRYMADYVCSGANDQVEIQAAIDALATTGGKIMLLEGHYYLASTVTLTESIHLQGQGGLPYKEAAKSLLGTCILPADGFTDDVLIATAHAASGIIISDIAFDGRQNDVPTQSVGGIFFDLGGGRHAILERCEFKYFYKSAVYIDGCDGMYIRGCSFDYNRGECSKPAIEDLDAVVAFHNALYLYFLDNSIVYSNYYQLRGTIGYSIIRGNNFEGANGGALVYIVNNPAGIDHFVIISDNLFSKANTVALWVRGKGFIIEGNVFRNNGVGSAKRDIELSLGSLHKVIGNDFDGWEQQDYGIYMDSVTDVIISGNTFRRYLQAYPIRYYDSSISYYPPGTEPVITSNKYSDLFTEVLAVSTTHVVDDWDISGAGEIELNPATAKQPDVPRTLSWLFNGHTGISEFDLIFEGTNGKGVTISETFTEADGWTGETSNAFAQVTAVKYTRSANGGDVDNTMDIGITDVLGLSNIVYADTDVYKITKNAANQAVVAGDVDITYDTYDMHTITLAATDDFTIWYRSSLNIIS